MTARRVTDAQVADVGITLLPTRARVQARNEQRFGALDGDGAALETYTVAWSFAPPSVEVFSSELWRPAVESAVAGIFGAMAMDHNGHSWVTADAVAGSVGRPKGVVFKFKRGTKVVFMHGGEFEEVKQQAGGGQRNGGSVVVVGKGTRGTIVDVLPLRQSGGISICVPVVQVAGGHPNGCLLLVRHVEVPRIKAQVCVEGVVDVGSVRAPKCGGGVVDVGSVRAPWGAGARRRLRRGHRGHVSQQRGAGAAGSGRPAAQGTKRCWSRCGCRLSCGAGAWPFTMRRAKTCRSRTSFNVAEGWDFGQSYAVVARTWMRSSSLQTCQPG